MLKQYDLRRWTFTRQILIDERSIPHSHPVLTLHTRHLSHDDELLSAYLHEQLHWFLSAHTPDTDAAKSDLLKLYPAVPIGFPDGAEDRDSTYLHLLVCKLEERADETFLGPERAKQILSAQDHYRWVYRTVLQDAPAIESILRAHHLEIG